jgi:hypothetical protein
MAVYAALEVALGVTKWLQNMESRRHEGHVEL